MSIPDRVYRDGRREWRQDVGGGWTKYQDNLGNRGFEQDLGNGLARRDNEIIQDYGKYIQRSDGTLERKWDR
jgi:hypothetical protein